MLCEPEGVPIKVKLTGLTRSWTDDEDMFRIQVFESDGEDGYEGRGIIWCDEEEVELILRPLSAMTDKEVLQVVSIALNKEIDFLKVEWTPKRDYVTVNYNTWLPQNDYDKERWERCELNIAIADVFTIYNHENYIKGNGTGVGNKPLYRQHEITRFLLSNGFDLFGLIEERLAIDKTKMKEVEL